MRRELIYALENMSDIGIHKMLRELSLSEIEKLFTLLEFTDKETIDRWSGIYARMYN